MSATTIRRFNRSDRDQLTRLVNAHLGAVIPGATVSVQGLMSHLEREPDEFIVDPWVHERVTLVAEQRGRVVAAAHLLRYGDDEMVGASYRHTAEIRWLVCWPPAPFWPDAAEAGEALMSACVAHIDRWSVRSSNADGSLPASGVYGVPEQWPHVLALYEAAGFSGDRTETVVVGTTAHLLVDGPAPMASLRCQRRLGINGTRLTAYLEDTELGYIEIDANLLEAGRFTRGAGWADVGNLHVVESHRRRGVATWLVRQAARWLELGDVRRVLAYVSEEDGIAEPAFWSSVGFERLTTTRRGLTR